MNSTEIERILQLHGAGLMSRQTACEKLAEMGIVEKDEVERLVGEEAYHA